MRTSLLCFLLLFSIFSIGQTKSDDTTETTFRLSDKDSITDFKYIFPISQSSKDSTIVESPIRKYKFKLDSIQNIWEVKKKGDKPLFLEGTLNILFSEKIATGFGSSNSLSLQKSYFNLDAAEKSLSIGYNFDNRGGDALKQLNWIYSVGAKIVASEGFATISTSGNLEENNIGANLKISFIGNGTIAWDNSEKKKNHKNHRETIKAYREFLFKDYDNKVKKYNKDEVSKTGTKQKEIFGKTDIRKVLEGKSNKMYEEIIREELKYIDSNKLFTSMWNWWVTLESYIPFGDTEYKITPITSDNKPTKAQYYAFNTNLSLNAYYERPKFVSYFGKLVGTVKGNSNIAVNGLTAKEFQSIIDVNGTPTLTSPVSAIAIDEYDRFVTTSLKAEVAIFYKNIFGFSPSIEKNWGTFDGINWKLGIPISLKPKKGESRVNFELQWRENETLAGNEHLIGFSTSFLFGSLVK